ncbi:hypothetical protein BDV96DRAFT_570641 [Lophiotrema nucula]|uniref:Voltage-gated hydrogen channel 1 n=1 Tax=Lophiotrema nucula TaxID=690887 RepID=A0A6A5ZH10_9PLEO|nr:hypothetical protein BDV96DRAFT_570641 [Lophiotrema nucula]
MSSSPLLRPSRIESDDVVEANSYSDTTRKQLYRFFNSKTFHYSILVLVSLDVACLFADIIINLLTCQNHTPASSKALEALAYVSLAFSCIFVIELLASVWAFGREYFHSKFHIFDATIILASFIFELALQGVTEEVASLIVILRLLRVVKIVDELSVGAEEQMKDLEERLATSEKANEELMDEVKRLRRRFRVNDGLPSRKKGDVVYSGAGASSDG